MRNYQLLFGDYPLLSKIKMLAPGTKLRRALDDILKAKFGALILFADDVQKYENILQAGFRFDINFAPEKLYELAKMDGAIVVDSEATKILGANIHLMPDPSIPTAETGTRHRTAERAARQTECMVLAVSHRRGVITVYYKNNKYLLSDTSFLIPRVSQALNTLDKYRLNFDKLLAQSDLEEFSNRNPLRQVVEVISKGVEILKIREQIEPYLIELGIEGKLAQMQLDEIMSNIDSTLIIFIMDCSYRETTEEESRNILNGLCNLKELTPLLVARAMGYEIMNLAQLDEIFTLTKGYRFLIYSAHIPIVLARNVVMVFKNIYQITSASLESLKSIEGLGHKRALSILDTIETYKQRRHPSNND